ncbi:MAG: hypothetical protein ACRCTQ_03070 [Brevinemataceae bacterium]
MTPLLKSILPILIMLKSGFMETKEDNSKEFSKNEYVTINSDYIFCIIDDNETDEYVLLYHFENDTNTVQIKTNNTKINTNLKKNKRYLKD